MFFTSHNENETGHDLSHFHSAHQIRLPSLIQDAIPQNKKPRITARLDFSGAACRIRTDDLPLTRRLLYQLS
jgi:hypothetical protein